MSATVTGGVGRGARPPWSGCRRMRLARAMAAMTITLLQSATVCAQGLAWPPKADVPSASASASTTSAATPSATNWAALLAEARAQHDRLQADPDAPAGAERRRASARLIALLS